MKFATVLVLGLGLIGVPAHALEQSLSSARYPLPSGGRLAVENVQGSIQVEGWDRAEVEITAVKTALGSGGNLDDVRVALEPGYRALSIRTLYAGDSKAPVRVDYRLRVPRQVRLEVLRTVEGDIAVRNIEGSMDARSLHGNILGVNLTGRVVARATNGNVAVSLRSLPAGTRPLRLDTLNGNVELMLPAKSNADVELSTVAGSVEGKYVFAASAVPGDDTRHARIGRGGVLIQMRTVRGNIRLGEREEVL